MGSPYDIFLGGYQSLQGYRLRSIVRDSAPLVAARFSTGKQDQSSLDLLNTDGYDSLAGGMFQRTHDDPQKVARMIGVYNPVDKNVYPTPQRTTSSALPFGQNWSKAESAVYSFASYSYFSGGTNTNYLYKYVPGSTAPTQITLPTYFTSAPFFQISSVCIHAGYLYIGNWSKDPNNTTWGNCYRMNIATGAFQDIGGGIAKFAELRGVLYGINSIGEIYSCTNEFAAGPATYTRIVAMGDSLYPDSFVEYNGALWIAKSDGIYRFDGISAPRVLPLATNKIQLWNGALYFVSGNWLYRFDGTTVTKVQYFGEFMLDMTADPDYLYISSSATLSTYQTSDKSGTYTSGDSLHHLYIFDGVGFSLLDEQTYVNGLPVQNYSGLVWTGRYIYDLVNVSGSGGTQKLYVYKMDQLFLPTAVGTTSQLEVVSSEFDAGFPSIFKSFEEFEVYSSNLGASDSLAIKFQYFTGTGGWSSWITLGTITSSTGAVMQMNNYPNKTFKRLKISLTATLAANSTFTLKGAAWRYTLQPRARWRWQLGLMAEGVSVTDRTGASLPNSANTLSSWITQSIKQKTPSFMLAPDYAAVSGSYSATDTNFTIAGSLPWVSDYIGEESLVAIKNNSGAWEIMRISVAGGGPSTTYCYVKERGYLGITPGAINAGAEVRLAYKIYVNRLMREQTILDQNTYDEQSDGHTEIRREYLIEAIEV